MSSSVKWEPSYLLMAKEPLKSVFSPESPTLCFAQPAFLYLSSTCRQLLLLLHPATLLYAAILSRAQQPLPTKGICPLLSPCKVLSPDTHLICSPMSSGAWLRLKPFLATCVMWPTLPCHPRSTLPKAFPIGCFIATHSSNCLAYRVFILQTTFTPTDCMESWGCLFCSLLHPQH